MRKNTASGTEATTGPAALRTRMDRRIFLGRLPVLAIAALYAMVAPSGGLSQTPPARRAMHFRKLAG